MPYEPKKAEIGVTNHPDHSFDSEKRRDTDRERKASIDTKNLENALKGSQDKQQGNIVAGHKLKEYSGTGAHEK